MKFYELYRSNCMAYGRFIVFKENEENFEKLMAG